ncbi:Protein of unknown function [Humidesulfovibrio mexicanus]|uniref:DUF3540 domain-containing protein n=1 Tax=Humidesulfovibrio mexicanus TaxID=147047 RepID=A0A239A283_9BACT|nr:DUF3540 domain-containing protein [Humidesulfovibrio mexicanus]SNR89532.1 Protein of unknown function [Humidesulfovibrio mexicanus]
MGAVIEMKREECAQREQAKGAMRLEPCRVLAGGEGFAVVDAPLGALSCRLAASCLLRPEPGDLVLAALPESGAAPYVLSVLERAEPDSQAVLDLPSGARVSAPQGSVHIEAAEGIALSTPGELAAQAARMSFAAGSVRWLADAFSYVGKTLELIATRFTETAQERDTQAGTWTQRLGDSFRRVEELDETQAGAVRTLARDTALLHGRVTYVQAEEFVKADGQEVHLG